MLFYPLIKQIDNTKVIAYAACRDEPDSVYMKINICSFVGGMLLAYLAHKAVHCPQVKDLVDKGKSYGKAVEGAVKDSLHRAKEEAGKICREKGLCSAASSEPSAQ